MMALAGADLLPLILALLIGVATGWWAWAHYRGTATAEGLVGDSGFKPVTSIAPAPAPTIVAAAVAAPKPNIAPAIGEPDDLLQIKGIGPKLNALCHSLGVTRFDQIAHWTSADIAEVDRHLGSFVGRIERDRWIEQAALLAKGDIAGFEARFGKLDSENH